MHTTRPEAGLFAFVNLHSESVHAILGWDPFRHPYPLPRQAVNLQLKFKCVLVVGLLAGDVLCVAVDKPVSLYTHCSNIQRVSDEDLSRVCESLQCLLELFIKMTYLIYQQYRSLTKPQTNDLHDEKQAKNLISRQIWARNR